MTPLVYTVEQAAELLAIGRTAAYEATRRGEIPSVRIGRSLRVPRHALEALLDLPASGTDSPRNDDAGVEAPASEGGHHRARAQRTP